MPRTRIACVLLLCVTFSAVAGAQTHDYQVVSDDQAITLMPELKTASAPKWVKPGMRILIHQASASVPINGTSFVEDPEGNWVNKTTGQKFRQDDNPGTGGHGYLQVDIAAVLPDAVVCDSRSYLINGVPDGPVSLATMNGYVTTPSVLSSVYVNPDVHRKYLTLNGNGITSRPTKYKVSDTTFDAVWQQTITDGGSITSVCDTDSGLILHEASCSVTPVTNVVANGVSQQGGGSTMLTQSTLASARQIKTPWTQGKLPAVLRDLHQLDFAGSQQIWLPDGSQSPAMPVETHMKVIGRGDDFIQLQFTGTLTIGYARTDLGTCNICSSSALLTPLAIDPADLAQLHQGQEIDRDPVTKAVTFVSSMGRDQFGHDLVTLSLQFPGQGNYRCDSIYDRSNGLMVASSSNNPILHQLTQVTLKGKN